MLPRNLRIASAAAIGCFLIGGVARVIADLLRFSHAGRPWVGDWQVLSLASVIVGFAIFLYCLSIKPEQPPGWHARHPWSIERLGPLAVFLALLAIGAIFALLAQGLAAALAWKLLNDGPQLAFALVVWESRWLWTQYAQAPRAD